jgi:hypothetical protein
MRLTTSFSIFAAGIVLGSATPTLADAPPQEVKDMLSMVGTWKGAATLTMGADTAKVKVAMTCQPAAGEWGVQCRTQFTGMPGGGIYLETDLFGYEPGTKKFHWFSVTNMGETHDHVSDGIKGNLIEFVHHGVQEGKPLKEVIRMNFSENCQQFDLRSETMLAGQVVAVLDGHAHK